MHSKVDSHIVWRRCWSGVGHCRAYHVSLRRRGQPVGSGQWVSFDRRCVSSAALRSACVEWSSRCRIPGERTRCPSRAVGGGGYELRCAWRGDRRSGDSFITSVDDRKRGCDSVRPGGTGRHQSSEPDGRDFGGRTHRGSWGVVFRVGRGKRLFHRSECGDRRERHQQPGRRHQHALRWRCAPISGTQPT